MNKTGCFGLKAFCQQLHTQLRKRQNFERNKNMLKQREILNVMGQVEVVNNTYYTAVPKNLQLVLYCQDGVHSFDFD